MIDELDRKDLERKQMRPNRRTVPTFLPGGIEEHHRNVGYCQNLETFLEIGKFP
jgi:hypothetical protein